MKTSELRSGYLVATEDNLVRIYPSLEEAEDHVKYQKEHMKSKATWYIVKIKLSDWKTFEPETK